MYQDVLRYKVSRPGTLYKPQPLSVCVIGVLNHYNTADKTNTVSGREKEV